MNLKSYFLKNNIIAIKWNDIEKDLSNIKNKEELFELLDN